MDSPNNRQILGEVKEKIYAYVGGKEKCEWSDAQIEGEVYFDHFSKFNVTVIVCLRYNFVFSGFIF